VFIGYLSSFFIALLLSFFYLGYAASGVLEQIKKELNKEVETEITEEPHVAVSAGNSFIFDYFTEISEPHQHAVFSEYAVDISIVDNDIQTQKICLSQYFLRPPPAKVIK
jgi:hypothetical protein